MEWIIEMYTIDSEMLQCQLRGSKADNLAQKNEVNSLPKNKQKKKIREREIVSYKKPQ